MKLASRYLCNIFASALLRLSNDAIINKSLLKNKSVVLKIKSNIFSKFNLYPISILIFVMMLIVPSFSCANVPINNEASVALSGECEIIVEGIASIHNTTLPTKISNTPKNSTVVVEQYLPDNFFMGATLLFRTSQQFIEVHLNDEMIYTFGFNENQKFGKTPGSSWHFVRLPPNYMGQKLTVKLRSPYPVYSSTINEIYYGTKSSHIFKIITQYGFSLIISALLLLISFASIISYFCIYKFSGYNKSILYLSFFAFSTGVWILCESRIFQLFCNNPFAIYICTFLSFYTIPISLGMLVIKSYTPNNIKPLKAIVSMHTIFLFVAVILQLFNIVDFIELVMIFHFLLVVSISVTICVAIKELKRNPNIKLFLLALFTLCATSIIDIFMFYLLTNSVSGVFTQIGLLLFVVIIVVNTGNYFVSLSNTKALNGALSKLAYSDSLTGIKNRTAFQENLDYIDLYYNEQPNLLNTLTIVVCDINNLKKVNDTFGHKEGDNIIRGCGDALKVAFDLIGDVYKIGGDEFTVFLHNCSERTYQDALTKMDKKIAEYNFLSHKSVLSVAIGKATYDPMLDNDVSSLFVRADTMMYENKAAKKPIK